MSKMKGPEEKRYKDMWLFCSKISFFFMGFKKRWSGDYVTNEGRETERGYIILTSPNRIEDKN